uniref:Uncharacterized protein n=1 Tax=Panagrellus redivivus TaxID=6233 RepID=A0A7E4VT80_PANRE
MSYIELEEVARVLLKFEDEHLGQIASSKGRLELSRQKKRESTNESRGRGGDFPGPRESVVGRPACFSVSQPSKGCLRDLCIFATHSMGSVKPCRSDHNSVYGCHHGPCMVPQTDTAGVHRILSVLVLLCAFMKAS